MDTTLPIEDINHATASLQQPYLRLDLDSDTTALLPMKNAQEVLSIHRNRITPIPNMPSCVFGLLNQRSRIFWVVDLPELLDMSPLDRSWQEYNLIIIRHHNNALGLIVPQIKGVIRCSLEAIQSPIGNVAEGLVPYLQGCILQEDKILLVLDAETILNSPILINN